MTRTDILRACKNIKKTQNGRFLTKIVKRTMLSCDYLKINRKGNEDYEQIENIILNKLNKL